MITIVCFWTQSRAAAWGCQCFYLVSGDGKVVFVKRAGLGKQRTCNENATSRYLRFGLLNKELFRGLTEIGNGCQNVEVLSHEPSMHYGDLG